MKIKISFFLLFCFAATLTVKAQQPFAYSLTVVSKYLSRLANAADSVNTRKGEVSNLSTLIKQSAQNRKMLKQYWLILSTRETLHLDSILKIKNKETVKKAVLEWKYSYYENSLEEPLRLFDLIVATAQTIDFDARKASGTYDDSVTASNKYRIVRNSNDFKKLIETAYSRHLALQNKGPG